MLVEDSIVEDGDLTELDPEETRSLLGLPNV
jgi:hypothetical protein